MTTTDNQQPLILKLRARRAELLAALAVDPGDDEPVELDKTRLKTELRRVDAAIGRVESRTYGRCCQCSDPIDRARLESDPATPFCMPCFEDMADERDRSARNR